ncbi:MAG: GreA/GreB family elongation factor [Nibricoccus sp.]
MDKARLRQAIIEKIRTELDNQTRAALLARDEATHEESKPENKYDTHSQEAAYLAEGQARLAAELQESIALYQSLTLPNLAAEQPITLGAVVTLEIAGRKLRYFLGPRNGGLEITCDGLDYIVITPQSPLGRQLLGKNAGETLATQSAGRIVKQQILSVE